MKTAITMGLLAGGALLLAACGDSGGADANADGEITNAEMAAEAASGDAVKIRAGQWENTFEFTEFDIPGVSDNMKDIIAGQMDKSFTTTSCITQDEADQPDAEFFGGETNENCDYEEFDRTGNTLTLRMTCTTDNGGTAKVAMDGDFDGDSFEMSMASTISGTQAGDVTMNGKITGRRIGDCPG